MSDLFVDNIKHQSSQGSGTITLGASGETISVPTGASLTVPNGGLSGQNYPAFEAYLSANQTITDSTATKVEFNTEVYDTNGYYDNATNYRFTPLVSGKYFVYSTLELGSNTNTTLGTIAGYIYKNGANYSSIGEVFNDNYIKRSVATLSSVIDMNGTTDYLEMFTYIDVTSGTPTIFIDGARTTKFGAYRIGA